MNIGGGGDGRMVLEMVQMGYSYCINKALLLDLVLGLRLASCGGKQGAGETHLALREHKAGPLSFSLICDNIQCL